MKRLIAATLAFILVFALTACGGTAPTEPADATTALDTTAADTEAVTDETTADEPVEMNHYVYEHVVVIGIDGVGAFIKDADTPNFDRIFENGCVTYNAYASDPSGSAQSWGSMLTGTSPKVHGLTNDIAANEPYPLDSPNPTLFKRIANVCEDPRLALYCTWCPILDGMAEDDVDVLGKWCCYDEDTAERAAACVKKVGSKFTFVQFDSGDAYGHNSGYGAPDHLERISFLDELVGQIYDAAVAGGTVDSTLFIVIADHGGTYDKESGTGGHGGWTDEEKYVTFAVAGKNVKHGEMGFANVRDLAAVVLYALGIEVPELDVNGWTAQVPENIFDEKDVRSYDRSIYTEDGRDAE